MLRSILSITCCITLALWLALTTSSSVAAPPKSDKPAKPEGYLGSFGDWQAWQNTDSKDRVCYMVLSKKFPTTKKFPRQTAHVMITHRPEEGSTDVVSYNSGYVFKQGSDVTAKIVKNTFSLFTDKDTAWAREPRTDHALVRAIRSGSPISITGTPVAKDAGAVTDTFSHKGAEPAYRAISTACEVTVEKLPALPASPAKNTETKKPVKSEKDKKAHEVKKSTPSAKKETKPAKAP